MNVSLSGQIGSQQKNKTALIVDDQQPVRLFVAAVLERAGYITLIANSAEEAIEVAYGHEGPIDMLVSDLQMLKMSGIEAGRELVRQRPSLKVLIMTGADLSSVAVERGWGLIGKPFKPNELLAAVANALSNGRAATRHV